jgi:hypothetical protein
MWFQLTKNIHGNSSGLIIFKVKWEMVKWEDSMCGDASEFAQRTLDTSSLSWYSCDGSQLRFKPHPPEVQTTHYTLLISSPSCTTPLSSPSMVSPARQIPAYFVTFIIKKCEKGRSNQWLNDSHPPGIIYWGDDFSIPDQHVCICFSGGERKLLGKSWSGPQSHWGVQTSRRCQPI